MFNNKNVRGVCWVCVVVAVLLAVGCVSAASEESGGNTPASEPAGVEGENASVGDTSSSSVPDSSTSVPSSLGVVDSPPLPPGGVTTTPGEEAANVVEAGEGNSGGGGEASGGAAPPESPGEVVPAEVGVSEEGLERLRRVLGEDKFAAVLEKAESLAEVHAESELLSELYGEDSGVWLGRLAGEGGFLSEEGLAKLAERRSGEYLARAATSRSEEELAEYAREGEEWMVGPWATEVSGVDGRFADGYSDEEVQGWAFYERAYAESYARLWEDKDLSTPVGAFCWAVLRVRHIQGSVETGIGSGYTPWRSRNLEVWHLEREAEERGIELEWETSPLDANRVFRRVLLEVTAPEVRSVVFAPGLPALLRPAAEALYGVYDELLALPLRRVRPTVEELSSYRRLRDLTEEEITLIWPEEFEVDYREEDRAKYLSALEVLDDEARSLLNAECQELFDSIVAAAGTDCLPWMQEIEGLLGLLCSNFQFASFYSCPLFPTSEDIRESELDGVFAGTGCTVDEDALERRKEYAEREWGWSPGE